MVWALGMDAENRLACEIMIWNSPGGRRETRSIPTYSYLEKGNKPTNDQEKIAGWRIRRQKIGDGKKVYLGNRKM